MKKYVHGASVAVGLLMSMAGVSAAQDSAASGGGWGGAYFGALVGSNSNDFTWNEANGLGRFDDSFHSTNFGLFGGYNIQKDRLVYGVEAEASVSNGDARFSGVPGPGDIRVTPDSEFAIRGRVGYDQGRFLPYLALGYSWTKLDIDSICCGTDDGSHQGAVVGLGTDIAITDKIFGRIEYEHAWSSEEQYTFCTDRQCRANVDLGGSSVRLGLGLRF